MVNSLLVEDDLFWGLTIQSWIGCEVVSSVRGTINKEFDLVILDLNLRESRGLTTFLAMKAVTRKPIIVMTSDFKLSQDCLALGACDAVVRARSAFEALESKLERLIQWYEASNGDTGKHLACLLRHEL